MLTLSAQEDHPGKMTQALVCLYICVHTTQNCTLIWLNVAFAFFRTFAVNINACLYLHGLLWALCLLPLVCAYASLILWAKVWNERQRHVADGEVRETFKLPLNVGMCSPRFIASPTPQSIAGPHVPPLFLTISLSLTFLNFFLTLCYSFFSLIFPDFCILFTFSPSCTFLLRSPLPPNTPSPSLHLAWKKSDFPLFLVCSQ